MKGQKIVFFDIDGTLVSIKTNKVSESTRRALTQLKENGHLIFVNSGRMMPYVPIKQLPSVFDGFCCGCGSQIIVWQKEIFLQEIEQDTARTIIDAANQHHIHCVYEGKGTSYFQKKDLDFPPIKKIYDLFKSEHSVQIGWNGTLPAFSKLVAIAENYNKANEYFKVIVKYMNCTVKDGLWFEFVPNGRNKGVAVKEILKYMNISKNLSYAIGDGINDYEMFLEVGHSACMKDHNPILGKVAELITESAEENGIYHALQKWNLI